MLKDKMMQLMMKKKKEGKELSGVEKDAKMKVVHDLKSMADEIMSDKLSGMKKVTVASDSKEGLKEGLEKAEEILEAAPESEETEESEEAPEMEASEEMEAPETDEEMDEATLDAKLEKLMAIKEKLKAKKM